MNLLDRAIRTAWRLVFLLLILAIILPVASRMLQSGMAFVLGSGVRAAGSLVSSGIWGLVLVVFLIGLGARLHRAILERTRRADGERSLARRLRTAVRRPAEGVPSAGNRQDFPDDPDPALDLPEWDR